MSFEIQSIATGRSAATKRRKITSTLSEALVSHTIRSSGGTLRRAVMRSRQPEGFGFFGMADA